MLGVLFLIFLVSHFSRHAFHDEPVSRLEALIIPGYAVIMAVVSLWATAVNWWLVSFVVILGVAAGVIQSWSGQLKVRATAQAGGRPVITVRRGWSFLLGWGLIFIGGFVLSWLTGERANVATALQSELLKELFTFQTFAGHSTWQVYLLSGAAGMTYTVLLIRREPLVRQAIARRRRTRHRPRQR